MNKYKRIALSVVAILLFASGIKVRAASFSASPSATVVEPGQTFYVSLSFGGEGQFTVSVGNGSGGGTFWYPDSSSIPVVAGGSGVVSITVTADDATTTNEEFIGGQSVSFAVQISSNDSGGNTDGGNTVQPPVDNGRPAPEQKPVEEKKEEALEKKDSNTRLKSLSVNKGTLSPEFSANEKKYNLILPKDTTEIDVSAETEATTSKVEISGNKELKVGSNLVIVKVTAEDESFAHYEITTVVDEDPSVFLNFGNKKLGVVVNAGDILIQEGYEETTIKVNGKDIKSYKNTFNGRTILYLSDEKGNRAFYLYDVEKNEVIGKVTFIGLSGKNYGHIELDDTKHERPGMIYGEVEIEKNKLMGWKYEDEALKDFSHVYLMNESGQLNYYQYESSEQSIQIYHDGDSNVTNNGSNIMTYVAIGLGVLALSAISFSVYLWFTNKRKNEVLFRREQREKIVDEDINDEKED